MTDERTLNLHGSDAMTGNVDHVIDPSHDPQVAVLIAPGSITGEINAWNFTPVLFPVSLGITVDRAQHGWPGTFDHQKSTLIGTDGFALPVDDINHHTRQRSGRRAGFSGNCAGNRRNHHRSGFCLPPRIDNGTTVTSDI